MIKSHTLFGVDGKRMMGKFVSEEFKEVHNKEWKEREPGQGDILLRLIDTYKTPARWEKARQHLRDAGALLNDPRDIGALIKEATRDVEEECAQEIKEALFAWAWPNIMRGVTGGLPHGTRSFFLRRALKNEHLFASHFIYALVDNRTTLPFYVGKAFDVGKRFNQHANLAIAGHPALSIG